MGNCPPIAPPTTIGGQAGRNGGQNMPEPLAVQGFSRSFLDTAREPLDSRQVISCFFIHLYPYSSKICPMVGKPIFSSTERCFLIIEKDSCTNLYSCLYCIGLLAPCKVKAVQGRPPQYLFSSHCHQSDAKSPASVKPFVQIGIARTYFMPYTDDKQGKDGPLVYLYKIFIF